MGTGPIGTMIYAPDDHRDKVSPARSIFDLHTRIPLLARAGRIETSPAMTFSILPFAFYHCTIFVYIDSFNQPSLVRCNNFDPLT